MRRQGRQERDIALGPVARLARDRGQRADHPIVVDERRDEIGGEIDDAVVPIGAGVGLRAAIRPGGHPSGAQDVADQALADAEDRQGRRQLVGQPGPRRDRQLVAVEDADRHVVDPQRPPGLVDDRAEQLAPVVRRSQPLGDAEDGIEALSELGLEAPTV